MSYAEQYERWIRRVETEPEKVFAEDPGEFTDFDLWLEAAKEEIKSARLFRAGIVKLFSEKSA